MLGCLLAAMGVSALLTYDVARRTREMGVRLALGCRPAQLYWGVVRRGVLLASTGVAIGCVSAIVAVRALRSTVFGLESGLLIGCATAALLILVSALVAAAIPARRVVRTDPLEALRVS
jgi:ABC-type antimicrobial peptide transport system permease subunit